MKKRTFDAMIRKVSNSYVVTIPMPFIKRFKLKEKDIIEVVLKLEDKKKWVE